MKKLVKLTLLIHRYLGFALSLLFVIWFLSGFVMMYVKYPTMRYHERLQRLPAADFSKADLTIAQALDRANVTDTLRSIRLGMLLNRPVYRITTTKGVYQAVFADDGTLFKGADSALAARLGIQFTKAGRIKSAEQCDRPHEKVRLAAARHPQARVVNCFAKKIILEIFVIRIIELILRYTKAEVLTCLTMSRIADQSNERIISR